ncbi:hypothetical protein GEMRC1_005356 [Eukaryota sp. GEM-RC1]
MQATDIVPDVPETDEEEQTLQDVTVSSNDGCEFVISRKVVEESETIKRLTNASPNEIIYLTEVNGENLEKSIKWMEWSCDMNEKKQRMNIFHLLSRNHLKMNLLK